MRLMLLRTMKLFFLVLIVGCCITTGTRKTITLFRLVESFQLQQPLSFHVSSLKMANGYRERSKDHFDVDGDGDPNCDSDFDAVDSLTTANTNGSSSSVGGGGGGGGRKRTMDRRSLLMMTTTTMTTTLGLSFFPPLTSSRSNAAIDVSGLRVDSPGNSAISSQLKQYDGSAAARVSEIKQAASSTSSSRSADPSFVSPSATSSNSETTNSNPYAATYAYRSAPGFSPSLTKLGFGERYRLDDRVEGPPPSAIVGGKKRNADLRVSFEFPSDWLQLDRAMGGLQYVDQRNGDKVYLLKAQLPENTTLTTVPKKYFGDAIFAADSSLVKSGVTIDLYRVSKSEILSDGSLSTPHRRLLLKYATVTGNGLVTERRGWVDAYQVDDHDGGGGGGDDTACFAYMLVTSSNAVKFEAQGRERDTVDAIVNSFTLERI